MHRIVQLLPLLLLTLTAGCGGGGGGASGGAGRISLNPGTVHVEAAVNTAERPTTIVNIVNAPQETFLLRVGYSGAFVESLSINNPTQGPPGFGITFKQPFLFAPATYRATFQVQLCRDSDCAQPLTGLIDLPVEFVVLPATGAAAPRMAASATRVSARAMLNDYAGPAPAVVALTFENVPQIPTVHFTTTTTGVDSVFGGASSDGTTYGGALTVVYKLPVRAGAGQFRDTLAVTACLDPDCVNPIGTDALQIQIDYDVANSVAGANGYTIDLYPLDAGDLVWDASRQRLYVALRADAGEHANEIATVDPLTGAIGASVPAGGTPATLALSDDGSYLYAGLADRSVVRRFRLPDLTPDLDIAVPPTATGPENVARSIRVAPGAPHTIAVSLSTSDGIRVFDDDVMRPQGVGLLEEQPKRFIDEIEWGADATLLYGSNTSEVSVGTLFTMAVGPAGVAVTNEVFGVSGGALHRSGGLLYGDSGAIFDPLTQSVAGRIAATAQILRTVPDAQSGRWFAVDTSEETATYSGHSVVAYDLQTLQPIASLPLPDRVIGPTRLVRFGTDGLAFIEGLNQRLVVIRGAFVAP